jgi:hypothetical protein
VGFQLGIKALERDFGRIVFSHISNNWAGKPLETYETVVNYIKTTKTSTGLTVKASFASKNYEKGKRISAEEMALLEQFNALTDFH